MSPAELVAGLRRRGAMLAAEGDGVRVTPARVLTDELRAAIRAAKPAVLAILRTGLLPCPRCRVPLDGYECCGRCELRLCQRRGPAILTPFAMECDTCLQRLFVALPPAAPPETAQLARLHLCPGCAAACSSTSARPVGMLTYLAAAMRQVPAAE